MEPVVLEPVELLEDVDGDETWLTCVVVVEVVEAAEFCTGVDGVDEPDPEIDARLLEVFSAVSIYPSHVSEYPPIQLRREFLTISTSTLNHSSIIRELDSQAYFQWQTLIHMKSSLELLKKMCNQMSKTVLRTYDLLSSSWLKFRWNKQVDLRYKHTSLTQCLQLGISSFGVPHFRSPDFLFRLPMCMFLLFETRILSGSGWSL